MNKLGLKLTLGGVPAAAIGIYWFVGELNGGDPDGILTGGLWKGPLLICAGIAAVIMGIRMLREENSQPDE